MAISITRYVDITSGLGGASLVQERSLVGRFFTSSPLIPPQTFVSFNTATEVLNYFGAQSEEYLRAQFYFSWISKELTSPDTIQFAKFVQTAIDPTIIPLQGNNAVLATFTPISDGSLILTMGGFSFTLTDIDFSDAVSLSDVAAVMQTVIRAESGGGSMWTSATVTYQASFNGIGYGGFFLTGGANGVITNPIRVQVSGVGIDITGKGLLGWLPEITIVSGNVIQGSIWSTGSAVETITETLTNSANANNNFGSFAFLTNLNLSLTNVHDAAIWNQSQNVMYMFSQSVLPSNAVAWSSQTSPGVGSVGGVGLTLSPSITQTFIGTITGSSNSVTGLSSNSSLSVGMPVTGTNIPVGAVIQSLVSTTGITLSAAATGSATESLTFYTLQFPEMFPMMIEAATDYNQLNAVQNYEYQQVAGLTASVTTDASANVYDDLFINYYGSTQQAGQQIAFYQKGYLQGEVVSTNIIDMNAYVNEIWLKDAATVALMNALLSLKQIAANNSGVNQILTILQTVINEALNNGTISVGKQLNVDQKSFITSETGDPLAWYQVQNSGYWVGVVISQDGLDYIATYTLIYSKNDVVRKIIGTHTLI